MKTVNVRLFAGSELIGEYHHVDVLEMKKTEKEIVFKEHIDGKTIHFCSTCGTFLIEEE